MDKLIFEPVDVPVPLLWKSQSVRVRWDTSVLGAFQVVCLYSWAVVHKCTVAGLNYLFAVLREATFCGCCDTSLSLSLPTPVPFSCFVWNSVTGRGETVV